MQIRDFKRLMSSNEQIKPVVSLEDAAKFETNSCFANLGDYGDADMEMLMKPLSPTDHMSLHTAMGRDRNNSFINVTGASTPIVKSATGRRGLKGQLKKQAREMSHDIKPASTRKSSKKQKSSMKSSQIACRMSTSSGQSKNRSKLAKSQTSKSSKSKKIKKSKDLNAPFPTLPKKN